MKQATNPNRLARISILILATPAALFALTAELKSQPSQDSTPKLEQTQPPNPKRPSTSIEQVPSSLPIIVNVVPPHKTEEELVTEGRERKEKAALDRRLVDLTAAMSTATIALAILTGFLVLATIGLVIFAYRQFREMQNSIEVARQAAVAARDSAITADIGLRITQRAYVGVEPNGIRPFRRRREGTAKGGSEALIAHFLITNVGHLPARDLSWFVNIECDERRQRQAFPVVADQFVGKMSLTPGTRMRRATKNISSLEFLLFNEAKGKYCFVWGQVRYDDGFGTLRTTDFCHRYNCDALRDGNEIPEEHGRFHDHGNDAT